MSRRRNKTVKPTSPSAAPPPAVRRSMRWLGYALAFVPLLFWPGTGLLDPFGPPKWLAAAVAMLVFFVLALREEKSEAGRENFLSSIHPLVLGALMIFGGMLFSSLFSPAPGLGIRITLRETFFVVFAVTVAGGAARRAELNWILGCWFVSAVVQSCVTLSQHYLPGLVEAIMPVLALGQGARGSMIGTIGNPEYMAGWLAAPFAAALIWMRPGNGAKEPNKHFNRLAAATAPLAIAAIFLSGGRGAVLAAAGAVLFAGLILWRKSAVEAGSRRVSRFLPWGIMLLIVAALLIYSQLQPAESRRASLPARLAELADVQSTSMRHRIGLYAISTQMILERPILGAGPGRFGAAYGDTQRRLAAEEQGIGFWAHASMLSTEFVSEAHCDPLQWWAEYGMLPVAGLALMLAAALGLPLARLRREPPLVALWAGLLALALSMWVSFPLHEASRAFTFWTLIGLLAGATPGLSTTHDKGASHG